MLHSSIAGNDAPDVLGDLPPQRNNKSASQPKTAVGCFPTSIWDLQSFPVTGAMLKALVLALLGAGIRRPFVHLLSATHRASS